MPRERERKVIYVEVQIFIGLDMANWGLFVYDISNRSIKFYDSR